MVWLLSEVVKVVLITGGVNDCKENNHFFLFLFDDCPFGLRYSATSHGTSEGYAVKAH